MNDHIPSFRYTSTLRRQIKNLLAISETPPRFLSAPDQGFSINLVQFIYKATLPYREVDGKSRVTQGWGILFVFTLEKANKVAEGPMRRWGLMDGSKRRKPPKTFSLDSDEIQCLRVIARDLDTEIEAIERSGRSIEPPSPDEARDRFFYEERSKSKSEKLADDDILAKARREHPEWDCDFSTQWMRKLADHHAKASGKPRIKRRSYNRRNLNQGGSKQFK